MFGQTESTNFGMKIDSSGITSVPVCGGNFTFPIRNPSGTMPGDLFNSSTGVSGFGQPSQTYTPFGESCGNRNAFPFVNQQSTNAFGTNTPAQFAFSQTNNQTGFGIYPIGQQSPSQVLNNLFGRMNNSAPIFFNTSSGSGDASETLVKFNNLFTRMNTSAPVFLNSSSGSRVEESGTSGTVVKFNPVLGTDVIYNRGLTQKIQVLYWCINVMKEYEDKSLEELRFEDYKQGRKGTSFFDKPLFPNSLNTNNQFVTTSSTNMFPTKTSTNSILNNPQSCGFGPGQIERHSCWSIPGSTNEFNRLNTVSSFFNTKPGFSTRNTETNQNFLSFTPSSSTKFNSNNSNSFFNLQKNMNLPTPSTNGERPFFQSSRFAPSLNYRPLNFPICNSTTIPSRVNQNQSAVVSNPIHDQILGLITTPFGDSSLLRNLETSTNKAEHYTSNLKSAFTVNKPMNRTQYKIETNSSLRIKPRIIGIGLTQKALFDSLEKEDSNLLETFQVHPSAKRLVFRAAKRSCNGNLDANKASTSSCELESSATDEENREK